MERDLIASFCRFYMDDISDEAIDLFSEAITAKNFKKGETLIKSSTENTQFYIIKEGIVASYSKSNIEEKEYIRTIHIENYAFTNLYYLGEGLTRLDKDRQMPSDYYKCLTNCLLLEGDFADFIRLTRTNHEICYLYNRINQALLLQLLKRLDRLSLLDATERYKMLRNRIPNIENLIPQYQIASYLNITPVQLSRIRKKLYSE